MKVGDYVWVNDRLGFTNDVEPAKILKLCGERIISVKMLANGDGRIFHYSRLTPMTVNEEILARLEF